jgi:hypothetical protein
MKTRVKQLCSAALALCLALTLNVPLCAAADSDLPAEDESLAAPAELVETEPTNEAETKLDQLIDVEVPATGQITINPYKLKVTIDEETGEFSKAQIVHQAQALVNHSDFPVAVNVSLKGIIPSDSGVQLVSTPPETSSVEKEIFLYVEFQTNPDQWLDGYVGADNQLIVTTNGVNVENVMTLAANGQGYFHFAGKMAAGTYPMWSSVDAFDTDLIFSFTALNTEEELEEAAEEADETDAEEVEDGEAEAVEAPADAEEAEPSESTDAAEPADEPSETNADAAPANGEAQADNGEAKADADASEAEGTADPANANADQANGEAQADADEAKADAATGEASEAQADADAAPADSNANSTTGNAFGKEDADAGESKSDAAPVESQGTDEIIELTPDDTPDAEPLQ